MLVGRDFEFASEKRSKKMGAGKQEADVLRCEDTMNSPQRGSRGAEMSQESQYF